MDKSKISAGQHLKGSRRLKGWTAKHLARTLGVSQPMITNYEQGTARPNEKNRERIERLLGVPRDAWPSPSEVLDAIQARRARRDGERAALEAAMPKKAEPA